MEFICLGALLNDVIIMVQPAMHHEHDIPNALPPHVQSLLGLATNISEAFVDGCWTAFNNVIWNFEGNDTSKHDAEQFRAFGLDHLLSDAWGMLVLDHLKSSAALLSSHALVVWFQSAAHRSDIGLLKVLVATTAKEWSAAVGEIPGTRAGGHMSSEGSPDTAVIAVVSWCFQYEHTHILSAMQQSLHIVFVQVVDHASLPQLVLAQECHLFMERAKRCANSADEPSMGDCHGEGASRDGVGTTMGVIAGGSVGVGGKGGVGITMGVIAGGSVGMGGRGGVSGVIPLNHAGSYSKSMSAPGGSRDGLSTGRG
jgi:hypothetical protein